MGPVRGACTLTRVHTYVQYQAAPGEIPTDPHASRAGSACLAHGGHALRHGAGACCFFLLRLEPILQRLGEQQRRLVASHHGLSHDHSRGVRPLWG